MHVRALNGRRWALAQPQFQFQPADSTRKNISDKNCKLMCRRSIIQGYFTPPAVVDMKKNFFIWYTDSFFEAKLKCQKPFPL